MMRQILVSFLLTIGIWSGCKACPLFPVFPAVSTVVTDSLSPVSSLPLLCSHPQAGLRHALLHYWDRVDFQRFVLGEDEVLEQNFVNFLSLFPHAEEAVCHQAVRKLVTLSIVSPQRISPLSDLAERYLYHPGSPFLNEAYFRFFLEELLRLDGVEQEGGERLRLLLSGLDLNRVGCSASDISLRCHRGVKSHLSDFCDRPLLLLFYDSECNTCVHTLERMRLSRPLARLLALRRLRLLLVCVEGETLQHPSSHRWPSPWIWATAVPDGTLEEGYLLRGLPSFYLLDAHRRVVLKDADFSQVERLLREEK